MSWLEHYLIKYIMECLRQNCIKDASQVDWETALVRKLIVVHVCFRWPQVNHPLPLQFLLPWQLSHPQMMLFCTLHLHHMNLVMNKTVFQVMLLDFNYLCSCVRSKLFELRVFRVSEMIYVVVKINFGFNCSKPGWFLFLIILYSWSQSQDIQYTFLGMRSFLLVLFTVNCKYIMAVCHVYL